MLLPRCTLTLPFAAGGKAQMPNVVPGAVGGRRYIHVVLEGSTEEIHMARGKLHLVQSQLFSTSWPAEVQSNPHSATLPFCFLGGLGCERLPEVPGHAPAPLPGLSRVLSCQAPSLMPPRASSPSVGLGSHVLESVQRHVPLFCFVKDASHHWLVSW
ncbi:hypothetical protein P7K49_009021 [Saguinus oedipus]|uniref:Uncharacterized protein n=1 Tax=Saguinus oedipus TaxID=9490 RepID=A0ABQ9VZC4_SAGOE|nr:hypothetical protein P7K49_009021 [Saguinus oedipus]